MNLMAEMKVASLVVSLFVGFVLYYCNEAIELKNGPSIDKNYCDPFKIIQTVNYTTELDFIIQNETEIGWVKHVGGIRPIHYDWNMTLGPNATYRSELRILIETISEVDRLIIDINPSSVEYDKSLMRLVSVSDGNQITCIKSAIIIVEDRTMVAVLNQKLKANSKYSLEIGAIQGKAITEKNGGSWGLRVGGVKGKSYGINTIFQMRGARTVIPSFDHPSLKATFRICIEHSLDTISASNTPINARIVEHGRQTDCYYKTPKMPLYVATIAVLTNFSLNSSVSYVKGVTFDLYFPKNDKLSDYEYQFDLARQTFEFMQNATKFPYPMKKYGLMNIDNTPFWGIENFGLASMEAGFTKYNNSDTARAIVIHEIIHQWLGNLVTVSDWREICLQEGLTAWIQWAISHEFDKTQPSPSVNARAQRFSTFHSNHLKGLIQDFNFTQDIQDKCFGTPPAILQMFTYTYGDDVWFKFLAKLVEDFKNSNANLTDWANTLSAVTGDKRAGDVLKSWYMEAGLPVMFSSLEADKITIEQFRYSNDFLNRDEMYHMAKHPILTPLRILTDKGFTSSSSEPVFIDQVKKEVKSLDKAQWFVVDPNGATMTQNLYSVDNYLKLFECYSGAGACSLEYDSMFTILDDFCFAFLKNWLPFGKDNQNFNSSVNSWSQLLIKIFGISAENAKKKVPINELCRCCMHEKKDFKVDEKEEQYDSCAFDWEDVCQHLDLLQKMGRNISITETTVSN